MRLVPRSPSSPELFALPDLSAALGLRPEPVFMSSWCAAAERRFGSANSQDLAQMVWAAASMGYRPSQQWCER